MNIYLSSQWSRRDEIEGYAKILRDDGHGVTSRWHSGDPMGNDSGNSVTDWREWAEADIADIAASDCYVAFTEPQGTMSRGGRHVEWGFGLTAVKGWHLVCGPIESQFYALSDKQWDTFEEVRDFINL